MFDLDKWQEIYHSVSKHKLRTILTAFGVFWGIFMLVLLLGAGKGLENGVTKGFSAFATNSIYVWTERTSLPYKGLSPGRRIQLDNDDMKAIRQNIEDVDHIAPRMSLWGEYTISYQTKNGSFNVKGDCPELNYVQPMDILSGRFINQPDLSQGRKVCVVGERVIEVLFGKDANPLGKYINIKGVYFKVVGTFKSKKKGGNAREDAQTIFIPLTTLQNTFNQINKVDYFAVTVKSGVVADSVQKEIKELLARRHNFSPADDQAVGSENLQKEFNEVQGLFTGINLFVWIVGIGTIIAGIVGVSNIMLIIVKERTKEIGIRKALGATPFSIISLIIQESVVITAVSGYVGLIIGVGLIESLSYAMKKFKVDAEFFDNPEVDFQMAITATILLVVTGALAGLIPATKAANISPIEALRDE